MAKELKPETEEADIDALDFTDAESSNPKLHECAEVVSGMRRFKDTSKGISRAI